MVHIWVRSLEAEVPDVGARSVAYTFRIVLYVETFGSQLGFTPLSHRHLISSNNSSTCIATPSFSTPLYCTICPNDCNTALYVLVFAITANRRGAGVVRVLLLPSSAPPPTFSIPSIVRNNSIVFTVFPTLAYASITYEYALVSGIGPITTITGSTTSTGGGTSLGVGRT